MKISENFIDCVNEANLYGKDTKLVAEKLIYKLPDYNIASLASILAIDTKQGLYVVKIRRTFEKEDGSTDIEKVHEMIKQADFVELSKADYCRIKKHDTIKSRTLQLMKPADNIIFKLDIDVSTLL